MTNFKSSPLAINPVKLADNAVLGLSAILRRDVADIKKLLIDGSVLCDYLITLIEQKEDKLNSFEVNDREAILKLNINSQKIKKNQNVIQDLLNNSSSHSNEDINETQEFLTMTTMPMWQNRFKEFREQKFRRRIVFT